MNINRQDISTSVHPWNIFLPRGMITKDERILLYYLAKEFYRGSGKIVDAGAFIGASAYCLASGLRDNPSITNRTGIVYSYDLFRAPNKHFADMVSDAMLTEVVHQRIPLYRLNAGCSLREIFEFQTGEFASSIIIHEGSLLDFPWDCRNSIEILFADVCKSVELNGHLLRSFIPAMERGRSLLIHQDFFTIWHPYIIATMEYLRDYFEIALGQVSCTRVYRLIKPVPPDLLAQAAAYEFSREQKTELMLSAADSSPEPERPVIFGALIRDLYMVGDLYSAQEQMNRLAGSSFDRCVGWFPKLCHDCPELSVDVERAARV